MLVKVFLRTLVYVKGERAMSNHSLEQTNKVVACCFQRPYVENKCEVLRSKGGECEILPMRLPLEMGVFGPK